MPGQEWVRPTLLQVDMLRHAAAWLLCRRAGQPQDGLFLECGANRLGTRHGQPPVFFRPAGRQEK